MTSLLKLIWERNTEIDYWVSDRFTQLFLFGVDPAFEFNRHCTKEADSRMT
jgi:hypothetical protein